jgi:hypothetical protein
VHAVGIEPEIPQLPPGAEKANLTQRPSALQNSPIAELQSVSWTKLGSQGSPGLWRSGLHCPSCAGAPVLPPTHAKPGVQRRSNALQAPPSEDRAQVKPLQSSAAPQPISKHESPSIGVGMQTPQGSRLGNPQKDVEHSESNRHVAPGARSPGGRRHADGVDESAQLCPTTATAQASTSASVVFVASELSSAMHDSTILARQVPASP